MNFFLINNFYSKHKKTKFKLVIGAALFFSCKSMIARLKINKKCPDDK